jgi:dipeptide/tripeptide permease
MKQESNSNPGADPMPFMAQLKSFDGTYWWCNWMELIERFAFYGVRIMLPVFMVEALSKGGPEFTQIQKGEILALTLVIQSFVPILSGGFADRYGFRMSIAASTILKILGYIVMCYTVPLTEMFAGMKIAEARAAGTDQTAAIFTTGLLLLALGTAVFKPGVQGLIANQVTDKTSALGWGVFYQMVNIGGFVGPMLAGILKVWKYEYVFLACSAAIALNFIPLFFLKEPARSSDDAGTRAGPVRMLLDSVRGLLDPRLFFYTIAFCGFWLMNQQFFDLVPVFINDWVDSRGFVAFLSGFLHDMVPLVDDGNLAPEWIININSLLISIFAFLAGYLVGKIRPLSGIIIGLIYTIFAVFFLAHGMNGWWIIFCIVLYSIGEMTAAPANLGYLSQIAPAGRKGQYMGYSNFTVGIGASIGSIIAGHYYQENGDKVELARRYLVDELKLDKARIEAIPKGDLMAFFHDKVDLDPFAARALLWNTYDPQSTWYLFGAIGLASRLGLVAYNRIIKASETDPGHSFNTKGDFWVKLFLYPVTVLLVAATVWKFSTGLLLNTLFFVLMSIFALTGKKASADKP